MIKIMVYTTKSIKGSETAEQCLKLLEQSGFVMDKIGDTEPLRQPYTLERGISLWTKERDGCWIDGLGMVGKTGSLMGKSRNPRFSVQTEWWDCPNQVNLNWFSFYLETEAFNKSKEMVVRLFKDLSKVVDSTYGYIGHEQSVYRQHVTGTLETRLPGVFWCNYFGPVYVDFFTKDKILAHSWTSVEEINGGLITFLSEEPIEALQQEQIEMAAKVHLGLDSFGDVELYRKNPFELQKRRVPELT